MIISIQNLKFFVFFNNLFTINDLLYDSPNYSTKQITNNKFYVTNIVKLEKLLDYFNYRELLVDSEIRDIFNFFISKKGEIYEKDLRKLPMTLDEYTNLKMNSLLRKKPTKDEKKEAKKFKTKIKTYTFR